MPDICDRCGEDKYPEDPKGGYTAPVQHVCFGWLAKCLDMGAETYWASTIEKAALKVAEAYVKRHDPKELILEVSIEDDDGKWRQFTVTRIVTVITQYKVLEE
jgi:hypothetical protein